MEQVRIDKWLWAVRLYKTRSLATEACRKGRVMVRNLPVKPSFMIRRGQEVEVRKQPVKYTYKVLDLAEKRMAARLVPGYMEDLTPPEELKIIQVQQKMSWGRRDSGMGRPTKKDRRELDDFIS